MRSNLTLKLSAELSALGKLMNLVMLMDIREKFIEKLTEVIQFDIEKYHRTIRSRHDFVDQLIISGSNRDYKCSERDTADCAIHVTNELNAHLEIPMLCFDHISFSEDMKLQYWFQLYVDDHEAWFDVIYSDGNLLIKENHNWGVQFEEVTESSLQSMLIDLVNI